LTDLKFITNEQLFSEVIQPIARARDFVWIGTADIKDLHMSYQGRVISFLAGPNFQKSFDKYPLLWKAMERQLCPRVHFKHIIIDGKIAYSGSANLTGAGLGMKGAHTRNFESGIVTGDSALVDSIMKQFDDVWMGKHCVKCRRREYCGDPIA